MTISREQAEKADWFHYERPGNPNGCERWHRNGRTQTWKTRPDEFRIPVKHGLYSYSAITQLDIGYPELHLESECPLLLEDCACGCGRKVRHQDQPGIGIYHDDVLVCS